MNDWSDGKKLGELRTVFAWWPVQVWRMGTDGYRRPKRKVWLKKVVMMWTFQGWVAYEDRQ